MTTLPHQGSTRGATIAKCALATASFAQFAWAWIVAVRRDDIASMAACSFLSVVVPSFALRIPDAWLVAPERPRVDRKVPSPISLTVQPSAENTASEADVRAFVIDYLVDFSRSPRSSGREDG